MVLRNLEFCHSNIGYDMLISIEGLDASGKHTQATLLCNRINESGLKAAFVSFPRYGETLFSQTVADYLNGQFGDVFSVDPHLSALLFAGDRFESRNKLVEVLETYDVVISDRYVASNLAYQAGKLSEDKRKDFISWLSEIEYEVYKLPPADLTLYLDVPIEVVNKLVYRRGKRLYTEQQADIHESNTPYLIACKEVYRFLIEMSVGGKWYSVQCGMGNGTVHSPQDISNRIWKYVQNYLDKNLL